ncbi:HTH_Tnp_Tc3_2 domain-containing protein [Trichonephila clavipes]|nr:HTH_Tnp_Tc3_2 domain-containing protein [Trichonephila clavipes]
MLWRGPLTSCSMTLAVIFLEVSAAPINRDADRNEAQVAPELQRRKRTGIYLAVTAKRNRRSTASDLSRQLSSATSTTVSRQTVCRHLGHIGLYARRPLRCVPLTATHCRLRLTWSTEHALWTP